MKAKKAVALTLLAAMLTGCATSRHSFYSDPVAVGDGQICRTLAGDEVRTDPQFQHALREELRLRGISESDCAAIVQKQNVAIGVGAILGAAIVAAAASSHDSDHGGRHHRHSRETYIDIDIDLPAAVIATAAATSAASAADNQWDWDQYENATGALVWGCRGVDSRELVHPDKCQGREMTDLRWPARKP